MFTGLIEDVSRLVERRPTPSGVQLRIETPIAAELSAGDSLAVNGVCLTAVSVDEQHMVADAGPETLRVTTLGRLPQGALVNLERPLRADGRLGGHFVQGHVDAVGHVEALRQDAEFSWLSVVFPRELAPYIVLKGSIAVDGISLTVARLVPCRVDIQIVPFTLEHTNLREIKAGDAVNLECDMVGKYVVHALRRAGDDARTPLSVEKLV
jgi:riboflavin synthase